MTDDGVRFERDGAIGRIVLSRPESSNAFDLPAAQAMDRAVTAAAADAVRVVLLSGAGRRFCAGGDVASMVGGGDRAATLHELASVLEIALRRMSELDKPVVAAVQGAVAGAGLAFVLNSDVVVAARSTKFVLAYSGIGLTPDCGVSYLLPRAIGQQRALEFALTGRVLTADEALAWGLIAEVVDDDAYLDRAQEIATRLAGESVFALGQAKRLIRQSWSASREENALDEATTIGRAVVTDEATERIGKFLAK